MSDVFETGDLVMFRLTPADQQFRQANFGNEIVFKITEAFNWAPVELVELNHHVTVNTSRLMKARWPYWPPVPGFGPEPAFLDNVVDLTAEKAKRGKRKVLPSVADDDFPEDFDEDLFDELPLVPSPQTIIHVHGGSPVFNFA